MRLERLVLENFRQFKGLQEIQFSEYENKNVTIIHAENGFGKTTLLKAILWCLFGRDGLMGNDGNPDDFEKPDQIIHEGLAHNARDTNALYAMVKLTFLHDDLDRYTVTRKLTLAQQKSSPKKSELSLCVTRSGQTFNLDNPQQRIYSIVPEGISRLLFFNGERINYLAMERNSSQVTEAIQQMLGLELLKTTIEDLKHHNVRGKLRAELKDTSTQEKRDLIERQAALEALILKLNDDAAQVNKNIKGTIASIQDIDNKLTANRVAHELQTKRIRLEREEKDLDAKHKEISTRLSKLISDHGYTLLTDGLIKRGREIIATLRSEGKIPARVLNVFLQELLEHSKCICTRSLLEGTPERAAVESLLTIAGDQDFNNAVGALDNAIGLMEGVAIEARESAKQLTIERLECAREIANRKEEIFKIHQLLGGKQDEEVHKLEEKRNELILKRDELNGTLGRITAEIDIATKESQEIEVQIRQMEDKEEAAAKAQRRVDAVEDCAALLEKILLAETDDLRPMLNSEIDRLFRKIMPKDYRAHLSEDFTLSIRKKVIGSQNNESTEIEAALSTGERTVTSLVFIASLVALAKRRSDIPTILKGLSGSEYPMVIDSPFGSLSIFREGVARYVPELAPQVVLFVSPKQYDGDVENALNESSRVGRRYYLKYYGPTIPERANPVLEVNGNKIEQYFHIDDDEYTEIVELTDGGK